MAKHKSAARAVPKKKTNKIIAITLIAVGLVSAVAVIIMAALGVFDTGAVKPIRSSREDRKTVGTIDGHKVKYEELKYITYIIKEQYREKYGEDIWDTEESASKYREQLKADVLEALKEIYATTIICDELGIKVNNREAENYTRAQIEDIVAKDFKGDFEAYKTYLSDINLTDAFMRFKTKTLYLDEQAKDKMIDDGNGRIKYSEANAQDFINYVLESDDFYRTVHIYYEKTGDSAADAEKLGEANNIAAELNGITDTDARYERMTYYIGHNGDYREGYVTDTRAGLYLTCGVMGDEYDETATGLTLYEACVVETEYEYFVVMRLPKIHDDVQKNFDKILAYYHEKVYFDYKNEIIARAEFKGNFYFDSLDLVYIVD